MKNGASARPSSAHPDGATTQSQSPLKNGASARAIEDFVYTLNFMVSIPSEKRGFCKLALLGYSTKVIARESQSPLKNGASARLESFRFTTMPSVSCPSRFQRYGQAPPIPGLGNPLFFPSGYRDIIKNKEKRQKTKITWSTTFVLLSEMGRRKKFIILPSKLLHPLQAYPQIQFPFVFFLLSFVLLSLPPLATGTVDIPPAPRKGALCGGMKNGASARPSSAHPDGATTQSQSPLKNGASARAIEDFVYTLNFMVSIPSEKRGFCKLALLGYSTKVIARESQSPLKNGASARLESFRFTTMPSVSCPSRFQRYGQAPPIPGLGNPLFTPLATGTVDIPPALWMSALCGGMKSGVSARCVERFRK